MKGWFDTTRNRLLLTLITFFFYLLLYLVTDEYTGYFYFSGITPWWGYAVDVTMTFVCCFIFVQLSIFYSKLIFKRFMSFHKPYRSLLVYAILLFAMNSLTAYLLTLVFRLLPSIGNLPFLQTQHFYVYGILATFISSIYTNAFYLNSYITVEAEKKRLEIVAMQSQLNALKQQIDPHFMFNNFSILSELIMEDRTLARNFLNKLSKVYRYVIQNFAKDTVPLEDELKFLDSYLYLMQMRYEGAIVVNVSPGLKETEGNIPPVCLQLLVENAIKHNSFSEQSPLMIDLSEEDGYAVVRNTRRPLATHKKSTGIGQRNILERYALLCNQKPRVEYTDETYTVRLPII